MAPWDFRPHGTIVDGETFACVTELQMRQAARLQYAVSMLTIHQNGNGYVAGPGDGAQQLAEVVSPLIRDTDLIEAVPSAGTVRVLLVGGELEDLDIIIRRIITEVSHHRFDERHVHGQHEHRGVLDLGGRGPSRAGRLFNVSAAHALGDLIERLLVALGGALQQPVDDRPWIVGIGVAG